MNLTCNSTLEDMKIGSEKQIAGDLTFHQLALLISAASTVITFLFSFYLIWQHALNYRKPLEQRHIIRILLMPPIYALSALLALYFYRHAVYYQVLSDCYEAFAIASFFALMCHYIAPDLHEQKAFFRNMRPVKPWVWPLTWLAKCCGGQRGAWRTPQSGLTWFNIIWIGIYQYCFIRVAMTIVAVVTEHFNVYCESSNSPVFSHIWVAGIESVAVTIAMYGVIQFYIQLKEPLAEHKPFLKVLSIKLVIFLSFWQTMAISVATSSTIHVVTANETFAYPDLKVGIPSLLLCVEMALFSILHLWAFPYSPYHESAKTSFYPSPDPTLGMPHHENEHGLKQGGFMGFKAIGDALNMWDFIKAFGRGLRWLFVGVRHRHADPSYQGKGQNGDTSYPMNSYGANDAGAKSTDHLPIASQFRKSTFGVPSTGGRPSRRMPPVREESAGLIDNAQSNPNSSPSAGSPQRQPSPYQDMGRQQQYHAYSGSPPEYPSYVAPEVDDRGDIGAANHPHAAYAEYDEYDEYDHHSGQTLGGWNEQQARAPRNSTQMKVGNALWGDRNPPPGSF
ncbi:DUF300-domain-containing protein [Xylariaceae sp. FL0804]|nr:DUF300-domain-containing protein [Xylariaceae sp. FL0804]